jgi:hypothetical protein
VQWKCHDVARPDDSDLRTARRFCEAEPLHIGSGPSRICNRSIVLGCALSGLSRGRRSDVDRPVFANQTALCARCGIDSVIGDKSGFPIAREFLAEMQRYWFREDGF